MCTTDLHTVRNTPSDPLSNVRLCDRQGQLINDIGLKTIIYPPNMGSLNSDVRKMSHTFVIVGKHVRRSAQRVCELYRIGKNKYKDGMAILPKKEINKENESAYLMAFCIYGQVCDTVILSGNSLFSFHHRYCMTYFAERWDVKLELKRHTLL
jgi:hypothetical protein